jgi:hypothetical protein
LKYILTVAMGSGAVLGSRVQNHGEAVDGNHDRWMRDEKTAKRDNLFY